LEAKLKMRTVAWCVCSLIDRRGIVVTEEAERVLPTTVMPASQAAAAAAAAPETGTNRTFNNSTAADTNHSVEPRFISAENIPAVAL